MSDYATYISRKLATVIPTGIRQPAPLPASLFPHQQALTHPDGSPVYRPAESVKTHGHPIRVYGLLAGASALNAPAARPATSHDSQAPQAQRQEPALDGRGAVLHAGSGAELLGAVAAFHEEREAR